MRIELLNEAEADLLAGFEFYEQREPGLGQYFLDSLIADIDSLAFYAGLHGQHFGFYRLLAKRFPHAIYYRVTGETVWVYAVLDCRQSPSRTAERLKNS